MKKQAILMFLIYILLFVGCIGSGGVTQEEPTGIGISSPTRRTEINNTETPILITTSQIITATKDVIKTPTTELFTPDITSSAPAEGRIHTKCLEIAPSLSGNIDSSNFIILGRGVGDKQRKYESIIYNMDTGQKIEITTLNEIQSGHTVSQDGKLMAYMAALFDNNGTFNEYKLVIATAAGTRLETMPWEDKWLNILDWTTDQRLLLSLDEPYLTSDGHKIPISSLVVDPFTGEQEILQPDVPEFLDLQPSQFIFWHGVIYDPTLTRIIYPSLIIDNKEMYTLVVWDISEEKSVTSLENIYQNYVAFSNTTPIPRWSLDGSQFAFRGQIEVSDELVKFEMYRVSRDGEIEQLTNLTSIAEIDSSRFSWSPDGKHIAILMHYLNPNSETRLAVIDVNTHVVTDYCIPVRGLQSGAPIWSPDGTQLLVMDETDEYRHVILVDIVKNYAAQIAEDYDPLGWMVAP
jgi:hypothetical protein